MARDIEGVRLFESLRLVVVADHFHSHEHLRVVNTGVAAGGVHDHSR